jgi:hypothetical protein
MYVSRLITNLLMQLKTGVFKPYTSSPTAPLTATTVPSSARQDTLSFKISQAKGNRKMGINDIRVAAIPILDCCTA